MSTSDGGIKSGVFRSSKYIKHVEMNDIKQPKDSIRIKKNAATKPSILRGNIFSGNSFGDSLDASVVNKVEEQITKGEQVDRVSLNEWERRFKRFWLKSFYKVIYDDIMIISSLLSCFVYIAQTYVDDRRYLVQYTIFSVMERVLAVIFGMDWLLNLILADHITAYLSSSQSIIDIVIVVSSWLTYNRGFNPVDNSSHPDEYVYYTIELFTVSRILRLNKIRDKLYLFTDDVEQCIAKIFILISIAILFWSAVMEYIEYDQGYDYYTWTYYSVVTIATVGYGDISPKSTLGRIAAQAMILSTIVTIPQLTQELIQKMQLQSIYVRAVYNHRYSETNHIVVCGAISSTFLDDFFYELFHEDHDEQDIDVVMLHQSPPSSRMIHLLTHRPIYNVTYLQGSALNDDDLRRAKADSAIAVFLLSDKFAKDSDEADSETILHQFSIKRFVSLNNPLSEVDPPLFCTQLIRPENRRHLYSGDNIIPSDRDVIICLDEIRMGILAKSALFPGTCALIMNIISSITVDDDVIRSLRQSIMKRKTHSSSQLKCDDNVCVLDEDHDSDDGYSGSDNWLAEYMEGCDWEVYTTELSDIFTGVKFVELSALLYEKLGVTLFALRIKDLSNDWPPRLLLNPYDYYIPKKSEYKIEAFVLAKNKQSSDLSFRNHDESDKSRGISLAMIQNMTIALQTPIDAFKGQRFASSNDLNRDGASKDGKTQDNQSDFRQKRMRSSVIGVSTFIRKKKDDPIQVSTGNLFGRSFRSVFNKQRSVVDKRGNKGKESVDFTRDIDESEQEYIHRIERETFEKNHLLRGRQIDLIEVTIKTSVIEEIPQINNHIIIMGKGIANLYDLVRPLRARQLGKIRHIVILYPIEIPHNVWQKISIFDAIVFVRGSYLEETDIRRAGIFRARQVIVLADIQNGHSINEEVDDDTLIDSDAILSYQCVKRLNPDVHVVMEIINQNNISYLDIHSSTIQLNRKNNYRFSPRFASGSVFTTSMLDTLVCQAFHNPQIVEVVHRLVSGIDQLDRNDLAVKVALKLAKDSGQSDDTFIPTFLKVRGSLLYQTSIPEHTKTYEELYKYFARHDMIPLGILRGLFPDSRMGPRANRNPYVVTNPSKDTELFSCDKVFVLSPEPIQLAKSNIKEMITDLQVQYKMNNLNVMSPEDELVSKIEKVIDTKIENLTKKIIRRMTKVMKRDRSNNPNELPDSDDIYDDDDDDLDDEDFRSSGDEQPDQKEESETIYEQKNPMKSQEVDQNSLLQSSTVMKPHGSRHSHRGSNRLSTRSSFARNTLNGLESKRTSLLSRKASKLGPGINHRESLTKKTDANSIEITEETFAHVDQLTPSQQQQVRIWQEIYGLTTNNEDKPRFSVVREETEEAEELEDDDEPKPAIKPALQVDETSSLLGYDETTDIVSSPLRIKPTTPRRGGSSNKILSVDTGTYDSAIVTYPSPKPPLNGTVSLSNILADSSSPVNNNASINPMAKRSDVDNDLV